MPPAEPMRILHLIDAPAPAPNAPRAAGRAGEAELAACALLVRLTPELDHTVCLIGGSELERTATILGVRTTDRIAPPFGRATLAARGLRRLVRDRGLPAVTHAWSEAAAHLALAALPPAVGVVAFTLSQLREPRRLGRTRGILRRPGAGSSVHGRSSPQTLLFPDPHWPEQAPPELIGEPDPARAVPPPAGPSRVTPEARASARAALGLDDEDVLLTTVGLPGQIDAVRFAFLVGLLAQARRPVVGLLPRDAGQLHRGLRFAHGLPARARLLVAQRPMATLLPHCDLGVWDGGGFGPVSAPPFKPRSGTLPIALAHAAGVPVVSPEGAAPASLYPEEARAACVGHAASLPELARKLIPLIADTGARAAASAAVASVIERARPDTGFAEACRAAYRRAAGASPPRRRPPAPAPTAERVPT